YWRYWLIANAPESDDSNFSFDQFAATVNKDLNDVLGNFINRVLKMTVNNFGQNVPPMSIITDNENELYSTLDALIETYTKHMQALEFRKAMATLREIWVSGNNYLAKTEPWKVVKTDMDYAGAILNTALNLIRLYAQLSAPIMPQTAQQMLDLFEISDEFVWPNLKMADYLTKIPAGTPFKLSDPLFQKIMPDKLSELKITYKEDE
ncbi:MAG: class I tRNA ligase family protein, partial [Alphaproteobacteria bacterium]|nr:class I tRNA ligase family protein [Alphaproteobacteria bacterium]